MICRFSFKNFRSYRDETVFDFQAANISEFENSLIKSPKGSDVLPVSAIYGPNGGGKSNLLQALACLINIVVKPINVLEKNRVELILQHEVDCVPFRFNAESNGEPTEFTVYFRAGENEYRYCISLFKDEIVSESLYRKKLGGKKTAVVFERDGDNIVPGSCLGSGRVNTEINRKMPFLSFLAINHNFKVIAEVQTWFESCIIRNYANPSIEQEIMLFSDPELSSKIIRLLNDMDIDITGYRIDESTNTFYLKRQVNSASYELEFQDESDGTKKVFVALPVFLIALSEGRLVIIDELDAKLHPKLLRYVISLFKNPAVNKHGAQLLFTSHDMSTLKNDVFRRDEIWFASLNRDHASELYSLYDIRKEDNKRINSTAAYDKQYLEGRYGADPYLNSMLKATEAERNTVLNE